LLLEKLETIPSAGTSLRIGKFDMEVLQIADNAIRTVRVLERTDDSSDEEAAND
jgi:Mg2+/Co2+ transporter CorB